MIIVQTYNVDAAGIDLDRLFGMREVPFPGDALRLPDGQIVLVVRRTFNAFDPDADEKQQGQEPVDVELRVRKV